MSKYSPKNSSVLFYAPLVILGLLVIGFIFKWQFMGGFDFGASLPPPAKTATAEQAIDHRALAKDTGLAADGKMLYTINCASCHGPDGQGNGPRAVGLNPPPRNYKTETFKYGNDIVAIRTTLLQGSPGSSMPSFALLPPRDVWAMAHYVRTLIPNPTPTDDAILSKLPASPVAGGGANIEMATDTVTRHRIPITLAMQQVRDAGFVAIDKGNVAFDATSTGAQLYLNRCAKCHGQHGEGMNNAVIGVAPYRYAHTAPLYALNAPWLTDRAVFDDIVVKGRPGRVHPGSGTLTRAQLDELYGFVQSLARN